MQKTKMNKKKKGIIVGVIVVAVIVVAFLMLNANPLKGKTFYYELGSFERYELEFESKTVTVSHQVYKLDSTSPSGKKLDSSASSEETYEYKVSGKDQLECDGNTYMFEIWDTVDPTASADVNEYKMLVFDSKFLDISKDKWYMFAE